ncbi:MAG: hypothetical protein H6718_09385 [Polyangiaceae bacterium]|nr:hypothetical protein [Polyangiaceae bacterium]MCB9606386.1 hypothetical protein [Polyangiaceae bacterium]
MSYVDEPQDGSQVQPQGRPGMSRGAKIAIGIGVAFFLLWFVVPFFYGMYTYTQHAKELREAPANAATR